MEMAQAKSSLVQPHFTDMTTTDILYFLYWQQGLFMSL